MANRNIVTVDAGVPVLCMHAPWELVSKFDCYMTMKAMDRRVRREVRTLRPDGTNRLRKSSFAF